MSSQKKQNKKSNFKNSPFYYLFAGFAMGSADIVPGVSGGTIALIVGVYEKLITSIKVVSGDVPKLALKGKIKEAFQAIPFNFLLPLAIGLLGAILTMAKALEWLLLNQPVFLWSFFFGLVIASVYIVGKRVKKWNQKTIVSLLLGAIIAFTIVGLVPAETPANLPMFFLSGVIAICAMILPGVSGSFLLIIMGKYQQILAAVSNHDFVIIATVGIGAVIGLSLFSRLLTWLFARYHDVIIALLTGFMIGSLRKLWPWKEVLQTYVDSHGIEMPIKEANILPSAFDGAFLFSIVLMIIAMIFILTISKFDKDE